LQDGDLAVHVAAAADHVEVLKLLHAKGANVNATNAVSVCLAD